MPHRTIFRRPAFWLFAQAVLIGIGLAGSGRLALHTEPDSTSYLNVDFSSWRKAVSGQRTLAYPILLRAVGKASPSLAALPCVQFALVAAAALVLSGGLQRYGFSALSALAAASTVLYSGFCLYYAADLLPDAAALAMAMVAVGCVAAIAGGGGIAAWIGLTVSLALAYQLRPAYLFLVPLAPILGMGLRWLKADGERGAWWKLGGGLSLAAVAPLAVFCILMWATTGRLGLVSFGGFNVMGIAGQLLTPELAQEMPPDLQPLARAILEKERQTPEWKPPAGYFDLYDNYDIVIWHFAVPAARELYGEDDARINRNLGELAKRILLARPMGYLRWLLPAAKHGVTQLFEYSMLDRPGLLLLAVLAGRQLWLVAKWRKQGRQCSHAPLEENVLRSETTTMTDRGFYFEIHALVWIALTFAAAKLLLVILVERPIYRYVAPASIFLPMCLALVVVNQFRPNRASAAPSQP